MTPQELRTHCDSLNPGEQTKLAKLIGMHATLLGKKLAVEEAIKRFKKQKKTKLVS